MKKKQFTLQQKQLNKNKKKNNAFATWEQNKMRMMENCNYSRFLLFKNEIIKIRMTFDRAS